MLTMDSENYGSEVVVIHRHKEFRNNCNTIASLALNNDGIIYGGFVRDEIVKDHYTSLFFKKNPIPEDVSKDERYEFVDKRLASYWDTKNDPETIERLLNPKDIDVFFRKQEDFDKFLSDVSRDGFSVDAIECTNQYFLSTRRIGHKKFLVTRLCTVSSFRFDFSVELDVCIDELTYGSREPPFNRTDFLCNAFVKTFDGVRLSNCTGTFLDKRFVKPIEKMRIQMKIIDMLLEKKTFAVRDNPSMITRIEKFLKKGFDIVNFAPFDNKEMCSVCLGNDMTCCKLNISFICKSCMPEYLPRYSFVEKRVPVHYDDDDDVDDSDKDIGEVLVRTPVRSVVKLFKTIDPIESFLL